MAKASLVGGMLAAALAVGIWLWLRPRQGSTETGDLPIAEPDFESTGPVGGAGPAIVTPPSDSTAQTEPGKTKTVRDELAFGKTGTWINLFTTEEQLVTPVPSSERKAPAALPKPAVALLDTLKLPVPAMPTIKTGTWAELFTGADQPVKPAAPAAPTKPAIGFGVFKPVPPKPVAVPKPTAPILAALKLATPPKPFVMTTKLEVPKVTKATAAPKPVAVPKPTAPILAALKLATPPKPFVMTTKLEVPKVTKATAAPKPLALLAAAKKPAIPNAAILLGKNR